MQRAKKRFGQHFLHASPILSRILQAIDARPGEHLIEIGPGHGVLTRPLLESGALLDVVELDRDLIAGLESLGREAPGRLRIHCGDALEFDPCACRASAERIRIVGNLPYNISTPLIFHLLGRRDCICDMHFMLQKEVVDRMAAAPGSRAYGRLSVMTQYHCAIQPLFTIGPGAFRPPPKVESAFVRLVPHARPPVEVSDLDRFEEIVQRAFMYRRKTLRNALRDLVDEAGFTSAGIDPGLRAERLSLEDFARITARAGR